MYAAITGNKEIALALIEQGANIDERDNDAKTALMYAAREGHEEIVLFLIEKGAVKGLENMMEIDAVDTKIAVSANPLIPSITSEESKKSAIAQFNVEIKDLLFQMPVFTMQRE